MIFNLTGGGDTAGAEYYVYTQTIPSQTANIMVGDESQEKTMYDTVWQLNFDLTYPIEIAGQSFATWAEFTAAASDYYITTNKQKQALTGSYDAVTVVKSVGDGFKAFNVYAAPITDTSVTFPEFQFILIAKFN